MFKADDYKKRLRKFAKETLIIQECDRGFLTETTAEDLYRAFYRQMYDLNMPLIPYEKLPPNSGCIHSEDIEILNELDTTLFKETKDVIYVKLNSVIDEADKQAREILDIYNYSRDGYKALYALIERFTSKLDVIPDMWSTEWKPTQSVFEFVGEMVLCRKRSHEKTGKNRRYYTEDEMKMELILRSRTLPQFQTLATLLLFLCDSAGPEVIEKYSFTKLSRFYETVDQQYKKATDGDMSTITDTVLHKIEAEQLVVNKLTKRRGPRSEVQCGICKQYGHSLASDHICFFAGKLYHALDDIGLLKAPFLDTDRLKEHEENATKYNTYNYPPNIKKFITKNDLESMEVDEVNVLLAHKFHIELPQNTPRKNFP